MKFIIRSLLGLAALVMVSCGTVRTVSSEMPPSQRAAARNTNFEVLGLVKVIVNSNGQVVMDNNYKALDTSIEGDSWREILLNKAKHNFPAAQNVIDIERSRLTERGFLNSTHYTVYTGLAIRYR